MLCREAARRATPLGYFVRWVDCHAFAPQPELLTAAIGALHSGEPQLMVVDANEEIAALEPYLKGVLAVIPRDTRAIVSGRTPFDPSWDDSAGRTARIELGAVESG